MERETGIEPATNSLEGCDSTTELLPPSASAYPLLAQLTTNKNPQLVLALRPATARHEQDSVSPQAGRNRVEWWGGKDSNLGSHWGDRFTVCCD